MKYEKRKVKKQFLLKLYKKFLGINLTEEVKGLHADNYKTLIKEIESDSKNGKISYALGLEKLIFLK